jgi:hypothetical protein
VVALSKAVVCVKKPHFPDMIRYLLALLSTIVCVNAQTMVGYTNVTSGLVGWWRFSEGTGTTAGDSSGHGNSGTLTNSPPWTNGINGGALSFTSGGYVGCGTAVPALDVATGPFSIGLWIYKRADVTAGKNWYLVSKCNPSQSGNGYSLLLNSTVLSLKQPGYQYQNITCAIPNNTWTHIVAVQTATYWTAYTNGVACGSSTNSFSYQSSAGQPFIVGWQSGGSPESPNCSMDDVRVYNRALSAQEISILYNLGNGQ